MTFDYAGVIISRQEQREPRLRGTKSTQPSVNAAAEGWMRPHLRSNPQIQSPASVLGCNCSLVVQRAHTQLAGPSHLLHHHGQHTLHRLTWWSCYVKMQNLLSSWAMRDTISPLQELK